VLVNLKAVTALEVSEIALKAPVGRDNPQIAILDGQVSRNRIEVLPVREVHTLPPESLRYLKDFADIEQQSRFIHRVVQITSGAGTGRS